MVASGKSPTGWWEVDSAWLLNVLSGWHVKHSNEFSTNSGFNPPTDGEDSVPWKRISWPGDNRKANFWNRGPASNSTVSVLSSLLSPDHEASWIGIFDSTFEKTNVSVQFHRAILYACTSRRRVNLEKRSTWHKLPRSWLSFQNKLHRLESSDWGIPWSWLWQGGHFSPIRHFSHSNHLGGSHWSTDSTTLFRLSTETCFDKKLQWLHCRLSCYLKGNEVLTWRTTPSHFTVKPLSAKHAIWTEAIEELE